MVLLKSKRKFIINIKSVFWICLRRATCKGLLLKNLINSIISKVITRETKGISQKHSDNMKTN